MVSPDKDLTHLYVAVWKHVAAPWVSRGWPPCPGSRSHSCPGRTGSSPTVRTNRRM